MASPNVAGGAASAVLKSLLDSPEIGSLIEELQATRWTGRPGYPIRTMIGALYSVACVYLAGEVGDCERRRVGVEDQA